MKYYITNNIRFIQGFGNLMERPSSATHMKYNDARRYVSIHPDHMIMKYRSGKKKNSYVVSTNQKYFKPDGTFVNEMSQAISFKTVEEAFDVLDNILNTNDELFVIDSEFKKIKRPVPVQDKEPSLLAVVKRISFSPEIRRKVAEKTPICAICGKPINQSEFTIDHILPLSRGGNNELVNLRPTHEACNKLKGNFTDEEMIDNVGLVVCNSLYNSPTSEMSYRIIRSIVRGTINKYVTGRGDAV